MKNRFLIVTGLSGSGKTVISRFLEDFGYFHLDNLPAKLIPSFVDLWLKKKLDVERVALVVDIREPAFVKDFPKIFKEIQKKISPRLIFLDASDECLIKRFSESRRPHPLAHGRPILEAVHRERQRMAETKKMADEVIDTTALSISDLKDLVARKVLKKRAPRMQVVIISFGYKYGIPLDSDLVFDTRFLPNPFYVDRLRDKNGTTRSVRDFVLNADETRSFMKEMFRFIDRLIPRFIREGKSHLTISIGCMGGKHRSVVIADLLQSHLKSLNTNAKKYHRDIYK